MANTHRSRRGACISALSPDPLLYITQDPQRLALFQKGIQHPPSNSALPLQLVSSIKELVKAATLKLSQVNELFSCSNQRHHHTDVSHK